MPVKITQREYANPYAEAFNRLQGTPLFNEGIWDSMARQGKLPEYIQTLNDAYNQLDLEQFNKEYGMPMNPDLQFAALQNKLYADNEKVRTFTDTYTDDYGQTQTKTFTGTQYEYNKNALTQLAEYQHQIAVLKEEQEAKDNLSGFIKFGASFLDAAFFIPFKGMLNMAGNIVGAAPLAINSIAAEFNEDFDKEYREKLADIDNINWANWFRFGDLLLNDFQTDFERKYTYLRDITGNMTRAGEIVTGMGDSIGKMIPTILLSFIPGVGPAASALYWIGLGTERAYEMDVKYDRNSVSTGEALLYSIIATGIEYAIGEGLNVIFKGPSITGSYIYGEQSGTFIPLETKNRRFNSFEYFFGSAVHEGIEEVSQDLGTYLLDRLWSTVNENMYNNSEFNLQTVNDAFWTAFLCSFIVGGVTSRLPAKLGGREYSGEVKVDRKGNIKVDRKGNVKFKKLTTLETAALRGNISEIYKELDISGDIDAEMRAIADERAKLDSTKDSDKLNALNGRYQALDIERKSNLRAAYGALNTVSSIYGSIGEARFKAATELLESMWSAYTNKADVEMPVYDKKGNLVNREIRELTYNDIIQHFKYSVNMMGAKLSVDEYNELIGQKSEVVYDEANDISPEDDNELSKIVDTIVNETSAKKVVTSPVGNQVLTDSETIIVPEGMLQSVDPVEIISAVKEQELVRATITRSKKDIRFKNSIDSLSKSVREFLNNQNLSDIECLEQILYNPTMFRSILFTTYKDAIDFLIQLGSEVSNELKAIDGENSKLNQVFEQQKQMLIEYITMQNADIITEQELSELVARNVLTDEDKNTIRRKRWSRDIARKIADGRKLNKAESTIITLRVNNSTLAQKLKTKLLSDIKSTDRTTRVHALQRLDTQYNYVFNGPFNGIIYPRLNSRSSRFFAAWLINNDITLQDIMAPSSNSDFGKRLIREGRPVTSEAAFNYVKLLYENSRPEHTIIKDKNGLIVEMSTVGRGLSQEQYVYDYNKMLQDNDKLFFDSLQNVDEYQSAQNTLKDLMNATAKSNVFGDIRVQDLIYTPTLLNQDVREDIQSVYGNLSPASVASYIHQELLNATNKNVGLTLMQSGEYRLSSVRYQRERLKNSKLQFSDIKNASFVTDYLNIDVSNDIIRECTIMIVKDSNKDVYAQYDPKRNTIFLYVDKNVSSDFMIWALLHETQHLVQTANGMNLGAVNVFTSLDENGNRIIRKGASQLFTDSVRKQIVADMKRHYKAEFEDCKTEIDEAHRAELLLYFSTGESQAFGQYYLGDVLRLQDENGFMTGFETPWGQKYLTKGKKDSVSALTYDGNEKEFQEVVKKTREMYKPFDYSVNMKGLIFPNGDILQLRGFDDRHEKFLFDTIGQNTTDDYFRYLAYFGDAIQITTNTETVFTNVEDEPSEITYADMEKLYVETYGLNEFEEYKALDTFFKSGEDTLVVRMNIQDEIGTIHNVPVKISKTDSSVYGGDLKIEEYDSLDDTYDWLFEEMEDFQYNILADGEDIQSQILKSKGQHVGFVYTIRLTNDILTNRTRASLLTFIKNVFEHGDEVILGDYHGNTLVDSRGRDSSSIIKKKDVQLKEYLNALWYELAEESGLTSSEISKRSWVHNPKKLLEHYENLRKTTRSLDPGSVIASNVAEYTYWGENIRRTLDLFDSLKKQGSNLQLPRDQYSFDEHTAKAAYITMTGELALSSTLDSDTEITQNLSSKYNSVAANVFFDTCVKIDFVSRYCTLPVSLTTRQQNLLIGLIDTTIERNVTNEIKQEKRIWIFQNRSSLKFEFIDPETDDISASVNKLTDTFNSFKTLSRLQDQLAEERNSSMAKIDDKDMPKAPRAPNVRPNRKPRGRVTRADVAENPVLNKFLEKRTLLDDDTKAFISEADANLIHPDLWDMIGGSEAGTLTYMKVLRFFKDCNLDELNEYTFNLIKRHYFPNSTINSVQELQHVMTLAPEAFALRLTLSNSQEGVILNQELPLDTVAALAGKMYAANNKYGRKYRKIYDNFPASELDSSTQRMHSMLLYDGSIESLFVVAAYGVNEVTSNFKGRNVTSLDQSVYSNKDGKEITLGEMIGAIDKTEFDDDITTFVVDSFSRKQKLSIIYQFMLRRHLKKLINDGKTMTEEDAINHRREWMKKNDKLSDDDIDKAFIVAMNKLVQTVDTEITQEEIEEQAIIIRARSNIIANIKRLARTIRNNLTPLARKEFDAQYPDVAEFFDEEGKLKKDVYFHKSKEELYDIEHQMRELAADAKQGKFQKGKTASQQIQTLKNRVEKQKKEIERLKTKVQTINGKKIKTYYVDTGSGITISTNAEMPNALKPMYQRAFKYKSDFTNAAASETQYLTNNDEAHVKQSAKEFLETNADLLYALDQADVDSIVDYFTHTVVIDGLKGAGLRKYDAIKLFILSYIKENSQGDMALFTLTDEQERDIKQVVEATVSEAGQVLTAWRDTMSAFDTQKVIVSHFAKQFKLEANPEDIDNLVSALRTGDYKKIQDAKARLYRNCESNYLKRFKKWKVWRVPEDRDVYYKIAGKQVVAVKVNEKLYTFYDPDSIWKEKKIDNNKILVYDKELNRYVEVVQVTRPTSDHRTRTVTYGVSKDGVTWADTGTRIPKKFKEGKEITTERIIGSEVKDVIYERTWNQLTEEQRNSITVDERIEALKRAGAVQEEVNESQLKPEDVATATEVQYKDEWFNTLVNRLWKFERMAMLSGPGTWIRNWSSNILVTAGNVTSDYVGNFLSKFLPKKWRQHREGQYKIIGTKVDPRVQKFITEKLIDTGWFKFIADSASKYNLETGRQALTADNLYALVTQMIADKIGSDITMNNQFDSKFMNNINKGLMTLLSDDKIFPVITKKAIYYLGRMMTEDGFTDARVEGVDKNGNKIVKAKAEKGYDLEMFQETLINLVQDVPDARNPAAYAKFAGLKGSTMTIQEQKAHAEAIEETNLTTFHVLNAMAEAYRLAAFDYMHRPNVFSDLEQRIIKPKLGSVGFFLYKQIFPFASASWNWFVEGLNYTPVGLIKGVIQLARLENTIDKMDRIRQKGTEGISSRFAEFVAKRNLGKGAIGSVTMLIGALLTGLGAIRLKDDDKKVLMIGNLEVDITRLFGTQGIMLGLTIGNSIRTMIENDEGFKFIEFFSDVAEDLLRDSFASDLYSEFKYNDTLGEYLLSVSENVPLSFVPNLWKWFVGSIVNNAWNVEYDYSSKPLLNFLERFTAQVVPAAPELLPIKVDPFTGEVMHKYKVAWINEFVNRILPFKISEFAISENEEIAMKYGISKNQLTGKYKDIGELTDEDKMKLNKFYGQLNSKDLDAFFNNKVKYSVEDKKTGKQKDLTFRQMTDEQIKSVINRIMTENASIAKVYVWTGNGHKYYGTSSMIDKLKASGVKKNVYISDKKHDGFIS